MKTKKELYINGVTNKIDILTSIKETIQEGSYVYAEDMLNQLIDYEEEDAKSTQGREAGGATKVFLTPAHSV